MRTTNTVIVLLASCLLISCAPNVKAISSETIASPIVAKVNEDPIFETALSTDGSELAIYANTGIYIYDTKTLDKTIFRDFSKLEHSKYKGKNPLEQSHLALKET